MYDRSLKKFSKPYTLKPKHEGFRFQSSGAFKVYGFMSVCPSRTPATACQGVWGWGFRVQSLGFIGFKVYPLPRRGSIRVLSPRLLGQSCVVVSSTIP